jgi:hypothetical protein
MSALSIKQDAAMEPGSSLAARFVEANGVKIDAAAGPAVAALVSWR